MVMLPIAMLPPVWLKLLLTTRLPMPPSAPPLWLKSWAASVELIERLPEPDMANGRRLDTVCRVVAGIALLSKVTLPAPAGMLTAATLL